MKAAATRLLRDIRTDHLQEHVARATDLSLHMMLRMFVLALGAQHVSVASRRHSYVRFDDLARRLISGDGTVRIEMPYREIEAAAREALARLLRVDDPTDPVGEWVWVCAGTAHPNYYTPAVKRLLDEQERTDIERGTRPWIPACVQDRCVPPCPDEDHSNADA